MLLFNWAAYHGRGQCKERARAAQGGIEEGSTQEECIRKSVSSIRTVVAVVVNDKHLLPRSDFKFLCDNKG